eukprot:GEMP01062753.1.p1 GENE.GEMP01062753.1~~GEMP01062753.1.p1  ORF type:complete len:217 (+),score=29.29 GEMP01062753.1:78-728(+)
MKEHRLPQDAVNNEEPWLHHQQAISHAVTLERDHGRRRGSLSKRLPTQLVFPDMTSCIGSTVSKGIFPRSSPVNASDERSEDSQQQLQNEPLVVYTTMSNPALLRPILVRKCGIWVVLAGAQSICMFLVLAGEKVFDFGLEEESREQRQHLVYGLQLNLHVLFLLSFIFDATFLLKIYAVGIYALLILALFNLTNGLDVVAVRTGCDQIQNTHGTP